MTSVHSSYNNDAPDPEPVVFVLGGAIHKLSVELTSDQSTTQSLVEACLDTGGGCNLVRADVLPTGTPVHQITAVPNINAAQGQALSVIGLSHLYLQMGDQKTLAPVEFLVVQDLVVPLLLVTPWIDTHVLSNEPRTHEVLYIFRVEIQVESP